MLIYCHRIKSTLSSKCTTVNNSSITSQQLGFRFTLQASSWQFHSASLKCACSGCFGCNLRILWTHAGPSTNTRDSLPTWAETYPYLRHIQQMTFKTLVWCRPDSFILTFFFCPKQHTSREKNRQGAESLYDTWSSCASLLFYISTAVQSFFLWQAL